MTTPTATRVEIRPNGEVIRTEVPLSQEQIDARASAKVVPSSVTMAQAREALRRAGVLAGVDAAIGAIPDADQRQAAEIAWEYAPTVGRTGALVSMLGAQVGLTEDQIDDLFIAAAEISF